MVDFDVGLVINDSPKKGGTPSLLVDIQDIGNRCGLFP